MNSIRIFESPAELADQFADEIIRLARNSGKSIKPFNLMLSGGTTPELLYKSLSVRAPRDFNWKHVNFFWGDERCVPHQDPESNYGQAMRMWLDKIDIAETQLHPMYNGFSADEELERNEKDLRNAGMMDLVILGTGEDGHFASVFPDRPSLFESRNYCALANHPESGQLRITVTPYFLQTKAKSIVFMVTGNRKAAVIQKILQPGRNSTEYIPARQLLNDCDQIKWYLDRAASGRLDIPV